MGPAPWAAVRLVWEFAGKSQIPPNSVCDPPQIRFGWRFRRLRGGVIVLHVGVDHEVLGE